MNVTLTPWEYKAAIDNASTRMAVSKGQGTKDISPTKRTWYDELQIDVLGSCGEIAVAKVVNQFWSPSVNTMHRIADVGADIEVRTTTREDGYLIVRENDADDRWFFLVTGQPPHLTVRGYLLGGDAKRDEWFQPSNNGYRPAWCVPQSALKPIPAKESV